MTTIMTSEPYLVGWMDHEGHLWKNMSDDTRDWLIAYFGDMPFSLRPVYGIISDEEEEKFNGY